MKALHSRGAAVERVVAGDHCVATLTSADELMAIAAGNVLCDPLRPVALSRTLEVQLRTLAPRAPLTPGQPFELYVHSASCSATLKRIVAGVDRRTGARADGRPPRCLPAQSAAVVILELEHEIPVETHADCRALGRIVLRAGGESVAVGVITQLLSER